jgi:hypothetical protein
LELDAEILSFLLLSAEKDEEGNRGTDSDDADGDGADDDADDDDFEMFASGVMMVLEDGVDVAASAEASMELGKLSVRCCS